MKLICINAKKITIETKDTIFTQHGTGLIEGEIYETKGELFKDQHGWDCYYIEGLGVRLACRFTKALEQSASISKEKYNFEEALEKALAEEDYEEAQRLKTLFDRSNRPKIKLRAMWQDRRVDKEIKWIEVPIENFRFLPIININISRDVANYAMKVPFDENLMI